MPQYLVAIHHRDNYDPSTEGEAIQLRSHLSSPVSHK
jgi:hypothetical protein